MVEIEYRNIEGGMNGVNDPYAGGTGRVDDPQTSAAHRVNDS